MNTKVSRCAPIIIPTLNRYTHLKNCLESLERCALASVTDVYIGLDYPPSEKYVDGWMAINEYLAEKEKSNKFGNLYVLRREKNYGIKGPDSNIARLIKDIRTVADYFIFSEDDNVFSPNYLVYMNQCLEKYKDDPDVIAVTGYSFPVEWKTDGGATVQRQNINASAWGWGWWTKKYDMVERNVSSGNMYDRALTVLKDKAYKKALFVAFYEYMCASIFPISYFKKIQSGRLFVTDYCTRQYLFVYDKYVISPLVSKVRNIGIDGSGAYCQNNQAVDCDGRDSWHTDFLHQEIDQNESFEIIENNPEYLEENRRRLDKYEWRPLSQHIVATLIAFGIRIFGLKFMRCFTSLVFKVWHRRVN